MASIFPNRRADVIKTNPTAQIAPSAPPLRVVALLAVATAALCVVVLLGRGLPGEPPAGARHASGGGLRRELRRRMGAARLAINYADGCCGKSQPLNCASVLQHGAHRCIPYNVTGVDAEFRSRNLNILKQSRGAGYWLWKPYVILKTLLYEMHDGDVLLYADSGSVAVRDLGPIFDLALEDDVVLFTNPHHRERQWTKPDAFVLMGCPVEECGKEKQVDAAFSVWRKSFRSIQFVSQWLGYMEDARLSTDSPSTLVKNFSGFADHRHDQSCLGLLAQRWQLKLYSHSYVETAFFHSRDRN